MVESWRSRVPPDFEFSVRLNRAVTHKFKLESCEEAFEIFDYTHHICNILRSEIIVLQTPESIEFNEEKIKSIKSFFRSLNLKGLRVAWELRGKSRVPEALLTFMQDQNIIHCVDISKEEPFYESDQLYTRLFGKGKNNIYQFTDAELQEIDRRIRSRNYDQVRISFHNVRMYKDAARLKIFRETGKFPPVTRYLGLESLKKVLAEDAEFPTTKEELIEKQGWKVIDLTREKRILARELLRKLPQKKYYNQDEVIRILEKFLECI
jgi:uncharacterized protein YecE (DUF72 family)